LGSDSQSEFGCGGNNAGEAIFQIVNYQIHTSIFKKEKVLYITTYDITS